jgi:hypothetical protein
MAALTEGSAIWGFGTTLALEGVSLGTEEKKKMTTKINLNAEIESLSRRETLVRDSKNVKVKTAVRAGMLKRG